MTEEELLVDCLGRLEGSGVDYMLVGSMAGNYWGVPRSTHGIDFVVEYESEQVSRIADAFKDSFFIQESSVESGLRPPHQFNALDNRSALKVDFFRVAGDEFEFDSSRLNLLVRHSVLAGMRIKSIQPELIREIPFLNAGRGPGGFYRDSLPMHHGFVDALPEGMSSIIATADPQGRETFESAGGEQLRLLGEVFPVILFPVTEVCPFKSISIKSPGTKYLVHVAVACDS